MCKLELFFLDIRLRATEKRDHLLDHSSLENTDSETAATSQASSVTNSVRVQPNILLNSADDSEVESDFVAEEDSSDSNGSSEPIRQRIRRPKNATQVPRPPQIIQQQSIEQQSDTNSNEIQTEEPVSLRVVESEIAVSGTSSSFDIGIVTNKYMRLHFFIEIF